MSARTTIKTGVIYATAAYAGWGAFPIYFKAIQHVSAIEIIMHRVVWSLGFVLLLLAVRGSLGWLRTVWSRPRVLAGFAASGLLLAVNWFIFVWAVNAGRVVDASLGYFINPLVSVLLGVVVLHERLRRGQRIAVGVALLGVLWLTFLAGQFPWIALILAATFGMYGLLRKTAALGALEGLMLETLLLFPLAFGFLAYLSLQNQSVFINGSVSTQALLIAAGPITAIPLLWFAAGARRIPLSLLGFLQYIAPTLQLMVGLWLYGEPLAGSKLFGFVLIWVALATYTIESYWHGYKKAAAPSPEI
jgi:chloramphenicol-sensitive protein RarD